MNKLTVFFGCHEEKIPLTAKQKQSEFLFWLILYSFAGGILLTAILLSLKLITENKPYTTCFGLN